MKMLSRTFSTLIVAATLAAAQSGQIPLSGDSQTLQFENHDNVPGFNLNLDELRLVQFSPDGEPEWVTEREKLQAKAMGRDYMDITDTPFLGTVSEKPAFSYPPPNSTIVAEILPLLSTAELKANLEHLTSYHTRYYNSDTGKAASGLALRQDPGVHRRTRERGAEAAHLCRVSEHPWKQNSIIIRIAPPGALDAPTTVLGAHIDSLNGENPFGVAPGAGDDGSGAVALVEAYRVSPLEFHLYAGEEPIASSYETAGKVVRGMMQFDMTAFYKAGTREEIAVLTNTVDNTLGDFLILVIERYLDIPWVRDAYPSFASSDDASWRKAGYQTCHPLEAQFKNTNPHVHSPEDRIDISPEFSFDHSPALAVAFAIEMSSY
ncbi:peptidase [Mycena olivaceomarginata]|nr:peptidase [Mycena olivaceomarginata]